MNDSRGALKNVIIPGVTETQYANDAGGLFPGTKLGSQHGRLLQGNQMIPPPPPPRPALSRKLRSLLTRTDPGARGTPGGVSRPHIQSNGFQE